MKSSTNSQRTSFCLLILFSGSGHYRCLAENQHGIASSNTVFVRESSLDNFKEEPSSTRSVQEGNPLQLPCEAPKGLPEPVIYWMIQVPNLQNVN